MLQKLQKIEIKYWLLILLGITLPFLFLGYGVEEDSWGTALAAFNAHTTGIYEVSRFPGHPFQEIIYALLWNDSPFLFNFLTAIFGVFSFYYLYKIACYYSVKQPLLLALAFFYTPVVFISSTYTIDYIWAMAFCLASWYALLRNKVLVAGILLAIAIACRISSGAMAIPFLFILFDNYKGIEFIKKSFVLGISTATITALLFIPVFTTYGFDFLVFWDLFAPSLPKLLYKSTIGVFGLIGCLSLLLALFFALKNKFATTLKINKWHLLSWLSMFLLFAYSYARLPQKSAYLINCIPPLLLFVAYFLKEKQLKIVCTFLIVSSFCCGINLTDKLRGSKYSNLAITKTISGQEIYFDVFTGPAMADYYKREQKEVFANYVSASLQKTTTKIAVISGWWYNHIMIKAIKNPLPANCKILNYENEDALKSIVNQGFVIYYLPEMDSINDTYFQSTFTKKYSKAFPVLY
ncbi:MAG: hypothetical protein V4667_03245 [Bacteroidota bacterium]